MFARLAIHVPADGLWGVLYVETDGRHNEQFQPALRSRGGKKRIWPCLMATARIVLALLPALTSRGRGRRRHDPDGPARSR
jgi:Cu/Ag efflux pump CusA